MQVVLALCDQSHSVTYIARTAHGRDPYAAMLGNAGIKFLGDDAARLRWMGRDLQSQWSFEAVLGEGKFDLAILSHWFWSGISVAEDYLDDIQRLTPNTLVAVLTDDFHGLRERRAAGLSGEPSGWERSRDFEQRELEIYRRADVVLAISETDRAALLAAAPELNIEVIPMAAQVPAPGPEYSKREGLLFLANFANPASSEGMTWFLDQVWPIIQRRIPGMTLTLAGNCAPAELAVSGSGIACIGHVPDLAPLFMQHRVFVSPILFGTGIKTKNLTALAQGLPLVTTTIGAEGMNLRTGDTALIADDPNDFAKEVGRVYTDADLWSTLAGNGRKHLQKEFSVVQLRARLKRLVERAIAFRPPRTGSFAPLSIRQVETDFPEVLTHQPGQDRIAERIRGHLKLAKRLISEGQPYAARQQLRHILAFVKSPIPETPIFEEVGRALDQCYEELGESKPYVDSGM